MYAEFSTEIFFLRSPEPKRGLNKMFLHVYCRCFRVVDPRIAQKPPDRFFFSISIKPVFQIHTRKNISKFFKNRPLFWPLNLNLFPKVVVLIFNESGRGRDLGGTISNEGLRCTLSHCNAYFDMRAM